MRLTVVGDSVSRQAAADWALEAHGCGEAESSNNEASVCSFLRAARSRRSDWDVALPGGLSGRLAYRAATTVANLTSARWFDDVLGGGAAPGELTLLNVGLWNLRYDSPRSQVPESYIAEASTLAELVGASVAKRRDIPSAARIAWRTTTLVEPRPAFPERFTAAVVREANARVAAAWRAAGVVVIDSEPLSQALAPDGGTPPPLLVDGLHLPQWASATLLRHALAEACAQQLRVPTASARVAADGGGGAAPAPSSTVAAAAGSASAPSPWALFLVAALTSIVGGSAWMHRAHIAAAARTRWGAAAVLAGVAVLAGLLNTGAPQVPKDRAVGADALSFVAAAIFCMAFATATRIPVSARAAAAGAVAAGGAAAASGAEGGGGARAVVIDPRQDDTAHAAANSPPAKSASATAVAAIAAAAAIGGDDSASSGVKKGGDAMLSSAANPPSQPLEEMVPLSATTAAARERHSVDVAVDAASVTVAVNAADASAGGAGSATASAAGAGASPASPAGVISGPPSSSSGATGAPLVVFMPTQLTSELKGACMVVFLLYHYWDVKLVYNPIRVMVAVFLFFTGYGNYCSLAEKGASLHKFALSFVRINLLCALLCLAVGAPWMLYYICPLHTFWTAVVYAFFAVAPAWNVDPAKLLRKLALLVAGCAIILEIAPLRDLIFAATWPLLQFGPKGMFEWGFRLHLDAYATLFGMAVASARPAITAGLTTLARSPRAATVGAAAALLGALGGYAATVLTLPKLDYNATHRFTFAPAVAGVLLLRNLTPSLQRRYSPLLAFIGDASLDFYLLQFHLWMGTSTRNVLAPVHGARWLSFAAHSLLLVVAAWLSSQAQGALASELARSAWKAYAVSGAVALLLVVCTLVWGRQPM